MTPHGHKDATTDEAQIRRWWEKWPRANIGVRTGLQSGLLVIDEDGQEGMDDMARLEAFHGTLPKMFTVRTGGGGRHRYFKYPAGLEIKNQTRVGGMTIDIRGAGGYVLAPPSNHISGEEYRWESQFDDTPLADAPQWLLAFITDKSIPVQRTGSPPSNQEWFDAHCGTPNFETASGVPEGKRSDTACRIAGAHIGRGEDPDEVFKKAQQWARKCDPPMDEEELRDIVYRLHRKEQGKRKTQSSPSTQTDRLIAIAEQYELFRTPEGETFVPVPVGDHLEVLAVRSRPFRLWLLQRFREQTGRVPTKEHLTNVIEAVEAIALSANRVYSVHVRVAEHGGNIYLDLTNDRWEVVEATPHGWRILKTSPVRFRRAKGMLPLPTPERGGSINLLRELVHMGDETWALMLGWLMSTFRPSGPYPLALLVGEQGSGKTTQARTLRALIDPHVAPLRSPPRTVQDLLIAANNNWLPIFDNLSSVPQWLSDALCQLSTGGGFGTRQLYTDTEEILLQVQRPVILTSIGQVATRPDLLDRCLLLLLQPIPGTERRSESEYSVEFAARAPKILGALLDGVCYGLANLANVNPGQLPRMADFARWAMATEGGLGQVPGTFLAAYNANRGNASRMALDSSPIAKPLMDLINQRGRFEGTAAELYQELAAIGGESVVNRRDWPKNAQALATELTTIAPLLRQEGYQIEQGRTSGSGSRKVWTIRKAGG
jgi:hypothetical protein